MPVRTSAGGGLSGAAAAERETSRAHRSTAANGSRNAGSREVYLSAAEAPERPSPADVLSGIELYKVHSILTGANAARIVRGPGRALLDGFKALGMSWPLPQSVRFSGQEKALDLTLQPPALILSLIHI